MPWTASGLEGFRSLETKSFCDQAQSYVNTCKWFREQILFHVLPRVWQAKIIFDHLYPAVQEAHVSFCSSKTPSYSESIQNHSHDSNFVLFTVTKRLILASRNGEISRATECKGNTLKTSTPKILPYSLSTAMKRHSSALQYALKLQYAVQ